MESPSVLVLQLPELLEGIFLQLDTIEDIILAQCVCKRWASVIRTSPAVQEACWYSPHSGSAQASASGPPLKKLNPIFRRLGVSQPPSSWRGRERDGFSLTERIYDQPGSWTTMLATQPPCRRMLVHCFGKYSGDEDMWYELQSLEGPLLVGDVMAILAECQNRQDRGVDRWAGVRHYAGDLFTDMEDGEDQMGYVLESMPNDVSIRVAVSQAWGSGDVPGFSLRRQPREAGFLHELIVHDMVFNGVRYEWEAHRHRGKLYELDSVCKTGEYKANLLAVKDYEGGYLEACRHIYRRLSDV